MQLVLELANESLDSTDNEYKGNHGKSEESEESKEDN